MAAAAAAEAVRSVLDRRLGQLQDLTGLPMVFGGPIDRDGCTERLVIERLRGNLGPAMQGLVVPPGQGLGGLALARSRPFVVNDYRNSRVITHQFDQPVVNAEGLNMTTGLQMNWVRGLNFFADISRVRETMATPIQHKPGQYFWYDQTTPSVMTYVVQQAIYKKSPGLDYQAWAQENFFNKLGIPTSAYWWQRDRAGNTLGFSQLFLRPLEFGRLGEVMLNNGVFGGRRIIDKDYMKQLQTGSKANCGNGFMVWVNGCKAGQSQVDAGLFKRTTYKGQPWISSAPSDMFLSFGYHGQHTFVIPSLDMVITRSGETAPDAAQNLPNDAALGSQIGAPFGQGYFNFFRMLMSSVGDMTTAQHARIANPSGAFDSSAPVLEVDMEDFNPMTAAPGSYLAMGPDAPQGCTFIGCEGEKNDGLQWLTDVPRTFPGVIGSETRPNG